VFESPIELAVNANRLLMEGLHGVLDLQLRNRSTDDVFEVEVEFTGRLLPDPIARRFHLAPGISRQRSIELLLPRGDADHTGSAGDAHFDVRLTIDAGEDGRHVFSGEFTLSVLAFTDNRHEINVSIGKLIEQHGDKSGMGALNEVNLRDLVKLPQSVTVNDLITQPRVAEFVPVVLEYEGELDRPAPPLLPRDVPPLSSCSLVHERTGVRLLVVTGDSLVLGKRREFADIVTWVLPRSDENDYRTRQISRRQCELLSDELGIIVKHRGSVNPTLLDGEPIGDRARLTADRSSLLHLPGNLEFELNVLPMPAVDDHRVNNWASGAEGSASTKWARARRQRIGAVLMTRRDGMAEREAYLWLLAGCALPDLAAWSSIAHAPVVLLALPHLCIATPDGPPPLNTVVSTDSIGSAIAVAEHDVIPSVGLRILQYEQELA
jgi:hypothetical protein